MVFLILLQFFFCVSGSNVPGQVLRKTLIIAVVAPRFLLKAYLRPMSSHIAFAECLLAIVTSDSFLLGHSPIIHI